MEIKIPKEIILNKKLNEKRVLFYVYFPCNMTYKNLAMFSCNYIVEWCGYKPNNHKGKINEDLMNMILEFQKENYLYLNSSLALNNLTVANINLDFSNELNSFVSINTNEIDKIKNFTQCILNDTSTTFARLLLIYSYFKINEYDNLDISYDEISRDTGIKSKLIERDIKTLISLNLLKSNVTISNSYSIYKFLDKADNIIYVGKSKTLQLRLVTHFSTSGHLPNDCYTEAETIYIHRFKTQMEMDVYEIYYINKHKPKYNTEFKNSCNTSALTDLIKEVEWTFYSNASDFKCNGKEVSSSTIS